jgi:hypothetical protein
MELGYNLVSGGSENHLPLVDLRPMASLQTDYTCDVCTDVFVLSTDWVDVDSDTWSPSPRSHMSCYIWLSGSIQNERASCPFINIDASIRKGPGWLCRMSMQIVILRSRWIRRKLSLNFEWYVVFWYSALAAIGRVLMVPGQRRCWIWHPSRWTRTLFLVSL